MKATFEIEYERHFLPALLRFLAAEIESGEFQLGAEVNEYLCCGDVGEARIDYWPHWLSDIDNEDRCEHTGMTQGELESLCGPAEPPKITEITRVVEYGSCTLYAIFDHGSGDNSERKLFSFYVDELSFDDSELIGLTEDEAHQLRHQRDVAYLRS